MVQWERICLPMQEIQETRVQSQGWEDPLEEEIATHSRIVAWKIPWTGEPGDYSPWGHKECAHTQAPSIIWIPPS